jgi:hypothetical protein
MEAHPGAVEAYPGAMEGHSGAMDMHGGGIVDPVCNGGGGQFAFILVCFNWPIICFGSIETSKLAVSILEEKQPKQTFCYR